MVKNWPYADLTKAAKQAGGPVAYGKLLQKHGFQKGITVMIPICIAGCVITYTKGTQVVGFIKDKLGFISKAEATHVEERLLEIENSSTAECPICNRKAHGINEITVIFGFTKNDMGDIVPNSYCKQCSMT